MKKALFKLIITLLFITFIPTIINAKEKEINMYLFYGDGCPHCKELKEYLDVYLKDKKNIILNKYEVWYDEEGQKKYIRAHELLNDNSSGVPYLIIGTTAIVGYDKDSTPEKINNAIEYYSNIPYKDIIGIDFGICEDNGEESQKYVEEEVKIPIIGKKNIKEVPIILSAIIIGLVDGFNPCAMWILIFLISMLLGMNNKKRMWILGISFLLSSAIVYFLFLISWLNLSVFLNKIIYVRVAISFIAILFGTLSVIKVIFKKDDGCEVVNTKRRKKIINYIRKIIKEQSFILAILGIMLLAASVNVIELLCSLGLPVMFTQILTINEVSNIGKLIYSIIYIFFFLIDDIIIFIIAMKTLEIKAISNKFGKYSHLIGGIIMIVIGILLIYKPGWLMFNF